VEKVAHLRQRRGTMETDGVVRAVESDQLLQPVLLVARLAVSQHRPPQVAVGESHLKCRG
jgi:hypothetical protein